MIVPRTTIGSEEYAHRYGAAWHLAYPAVGRVQRVPPIRYGPRVADFETPVDPVPDLGVLELADGFVVGGEGWVVSKEGHLFPEQTWYGPHRDEMERRLPRKPQRVLRVRGSCLTLATRSAARNYGHYLLDGIGRLALLEKAGMSLGDIDHVYCAAPSKRAMRMLERAGVPLDRCIEAADGVAVRADTLIAPTFPGSRRNYQPWLVEFLRRSVPETTAMPTRRLYIKRVLDRRVLNEDRLLPILEEVGFEIYDPGEHLDPSLDFAQAAVVVGPHGAGLADLAFSRPGTSVLELIPEDHVVPYWYTLSEAGGLGYGYLVADAIPTAAGSSKSDLLVDEADFREALTGTIALSTAA